MIDVSADDHVTGNIELLTWIYRLMS